MQATPLEKDAMLIRPVVCPIEWLEGHDFVVPIKIAASPVSHSTREMVSYIELILETPGRRHPAEFTWLRKSRRNRQRGSGGVWDIPGDLATPGSIRQWEDSLVTFSTKSKT
jgi:hypothetical protein